MCMKGVACVPTTHRHNNNTSQCFPGFFFAPLGSCVSLSSHCTVYWTYSSGGRKKQLKHCKGKSVASFSIGNGPFPSPLSFYAEKHRYSCSWLLREVEVR